MYSCDEPNTYDIGDVALCDGFFTSGGEAADPQVVQFLIRHKDDAEETTFTFGENPVDTAGGPVSVIKLGTGSYRTPWPITRSGTHYYRYEGEGGVIAAGDREFHVRKSKVLQR